MGVRNEKKQPIYSKDDVEHVISFPGVKQGDEMPEGNSPLISSKRVIDPLKGAVAF